MPFEENLTRTTQSFQRFLKPSLDVQTNLEQDITEIPRLDAKCFISVKNRTIRMDSFLCPNGTIFSQKNFVCVWWWQYDCSQTEKDYELNANLYSSGGSDYQDKSNQVEAGGDASGYTQSDDGRFRLFITLCLPSLS